MRGAEMTGLLVPWNASWTGEDAYEIRNCRWAGGKPAIWSPHRPGERKPVFAKPHMVRQRQSVARMICTVCGEPTRPSDRWWFGLGNKIDHWALATTEAPVHRSCADHAQKVCPHLRALGQKPMRWTPPDAVVAAIVGGPNTDRDFGFALGQRKVIGHLKFVWRRVPVSMRLIAGEVL
jgi:hypothetical protein